MVFVAALILFWPNNKIRIIALTGLFLFLGLWRYAIGLPVNTPDKISYYNGQSVTITGVVANESDIRQRNMKLEVRSERLVDSDRKVDGKILVTTNLYPRYNYGDKLEITCDLQAPEEFQGFAYDRYLARYDIYSVCYYPRLVNLGTGQGNWLYGKIFKLKDKFRDTINQGLGEPEASLARAIILGDKRSIPNDLREKFSQAGISHIVAISGMHISILAALVSVFLLSIGLKRKHAFYASGLFLVFYIILIGLPASAMRAGLMGFLVLWALYLGRLNKLVNTLVLAAVILLLVNPKLLRDDIGFQLSFLAVLGITYVYPLFNSWFEKILEKRLLFLKTSSAFKGVRDILNITIAAQVFTLPIIAYNFSQVSIIAPLTNLLILWALPVVMVAVLGALGLSLMLPAFSVAFFWPSLALLKYIIIITNSLLKIPVSFITINYLWLGWVLLYYAAVLWMIKFFYQRKTAQG